MSEEVKKDIVIKESKDKVEVTPVIEAPKVESKPVTQKTEAPKVESKPATQKTEAPKVESKPVTQKTEAPKQDASKKETPANDKKPVVGKPTNERPSFNNGNNRNNRDGKRRPRFERPRSDFEDKVISIRRVVKVVKGGRRFRFSALVVTGNKKGQVGYGFGKSNEVPDAIKKAIKDAKKNLITVNVIKPSDTVSCEWISKHDSSKVLLKPAKEGTGLIASSSVRSVLELAGIRNVYTKSLGSNTPQNVILATMKALNEMPTKESIMALRDLKEL